MSELWRNAVVMAGIAAVMVIAANFRQARWGMPLLLGAATGAAFKLDILRTSFVLDALRSDVPWVATLVLTAWAMQSGAAWARPTAWPAVVLMTAVAGDGLVAAGLALAEPDPDRRARLVLAASGASIVGVTSGAAPLLLGHGGVEAMVLGLVLALVGFAPGGGVAFARPNLKAAGGAMIVPLCAGPLAMLVSASGVSEAIASGIERVPQLYPAQPAFPVAAASLLAGALGQEGMIALLAREVLDRALSLRDEGLVQAIRVGVAVGAGLPMLVFSGSRLRRGIPLWLVQVGIVGAWAWFR